MAAAKPSDVPQIHPGSIAEWRAWLAANHASATGVWFVSWRRGHGPVLDYGAAVEEALCFGWIDSKAQAIDERRARQYYAPRRPSSGWSASNKERVKRLIREGRMAPSGLAAIERAKANGSWSMLDSVEQGLVPDDLAAALAGSPPAADRFTAFPPSARKQILGWIATARRPETRAARIQETAERAARGERANEPRTRD